MINTIIELYKEGKTIHEISSETGFSCNTITNKLWSYRKSLGKEDADSLNRKRVYSKEEDEMILALYKKMPANLFIMKKMPYRTLKAVSKRYNYLISKRSE